MKNQVIKNQNHQTFESIKHTDETGKEYWLASQFAKVLGYVQYRNFQLVIEHARESVKIAASLWQTILLMSAIWLKLALVLAALCMMSSFRVMPVI